jgi:hypothetical protein
VSYEHVFSFGRRTYGITTSPTPLYVEQHRSFQSWAVLVRGAICTGPLGALLLLGTGYTRIGHARVAWSASFHGTPTTFSFAPRATRISSLQVC